MPGSLAFALAAKSGGGGKVRSSWAKVSSAVVLLVPLAIAHPPSLSGSASMRLDRGGRPLVEGPQVGDVMDRQRQQPAEAIEVPVVRMAGCRPGVRLRRELRPQPAHGPGGLLGEREDARPGHRGRGRSWLTGRARFLSLRETKGDE